MIMMYDFLFDDDDDDDMMNEAVDINV